EDQLRARAKVTMRKLPSGIIRFIADMHPEGAGFVCAALDAHTAPRRQVAFHADDDGDRPPAANPDDIDTRPLAEKRVDALIAVCRESLANDQGTLAGTSVTMLVTVPLETLQTGVGTATIAGVDEPISAGTARRLAADAELIPVVLGADSEVLDLGR